MNIQKTNFNKIQKKILDYFFTSWNGSWQRFSSGVITLLLGFYIGSNVTSYFLEKIDQRILAVLIMVIIIEFLIRVRSIVKDNPWPLTWLAIDNLRIGAVYAVALEAFKLGS